MFFGKTILVGFRGEQLLFDAEDEGRAAAGKLQRWGLEAQEKWGDGDWEKDRGLL